jgi:DNA-binding Xre family transcriptional regulator
VIRSKLAEIAEAKGFNRHSLSVATGLSYSSVVDLWLDRTRRIDKDTLNRLCRVLGVQPGDLLIYEATAAEEEEIDVPELVAA